MLVQPADFSVLPRCVLPPVLGSSQVVQQTPTFTYITLFYSVSWSYPLYQQYTTSTLHYIPYITSQHSKCSVCRVRSVEGSSVTWSSLLTATKAKWSPTHPTYQPTPHIAGMMSVGMPQIICSSFTPLKGEVIFMSCNSKNCNGIKHL